MNPILSICVPTFNRAELLRRFLAVAERQITALGDKVEVVISDNCSPDNTPEVIGEFQTRFPVNYRRLPRNMGGTYNIVTIVTQQAKGLYCWVVGDDDLLRPGAVAKMLDIIEQNPEIPYIFVNHSYEAESERSKYEGSVPLASFNEETLLCRHMAEENVERWENIVFWSEVPGIFTFIGCHIFRREIWMRRAALFSEAELLDAFNSMTFWNVFPHVQMLASEMIGQPAYYVGYPYVALFVGAQEWLGIWPKLLFTLVLKIPERIEKEDGNKAAAVRYRNVIFRHCSEQLRGLLFHVNRTVANGELWTTLKLNKRDDWSFWRSCLRYWGYREFWRMVGRALMVEASERANAARCAGRKILHRLPFLRRLKMRLALRQKR